MGNFNRGNRFGGGGRRDFGEMHKAICSKCGDQCEVPFKPRGDKPVYCNNCFAGSRNSDSRFERRDSDRRSFDDRQMFKAVCDECGKECNLPFQPKNGKPVYCSKCFENKGNGGRINTNQYKEQFEKLNSKLDKILKFLTPVISPKVIQEEKIVKNIKESKVKKETKKKKAVAKK